MADRLGATVRVPLADALSRRLPPVCVMTGDRADGYVPIAAGHSLLTGIIRYVGTRTRTSYIVVLPMCEAAYERWHRLHATRVWCAYLGVLGLVLAAATRWLGAIAAVILAASVVSLVSALAAHVKAPWSQPSITVDAAGRQVTLAGVHPRFAAAVQ